MWARRMRVRSSAVKGVGMGDLLADRGDESDGFQEGAMVRLPGKRGVRLSSRR